MGTPDVEVVFPSLDGIRLSGSLTVPGGSVERAAVLVHGGGVTRDEAGFFTRLALGLSRAGIASLRFDLRGHGTSEGRQEDLTLSAVLNDIRVALAEVRRATGAARTSLIGQSFGGGICGYYAAKRPADVDRLVMLCPQLNYKRRTIDSRSYWIDDHLTDEMAARLTAQGYIDFSPTFRHGRAMLNEVFWLQPHTVLGEIVAPTLLVHGTGDTLVPIDSSRQAMTQFTCPHQLLEIEGAQHGFAVDNDPTYLNPQSQAWQSQVIDAVSQWLAAD